jgi:hypothetical protein
MGASLPPISLPAGRTAAKIFASLGGAIASPNVGTVGHTCALLDNSRLACWGFDANGQTGVTDTGKHGAAAGTMGDALPIVPVF